MLQSAEEAEKHLDSGRSLLGPGWREVPSLDDLSDDDEYTSDEEELYAILDLDQAIERQTLQTESTYQLIGIDTPVPFLKFGNQVYQGEMTPIIGNEVILGLVRNPANPSQPSHPPLHTISHHLTFRPITLYPKDELPPYPNGQKGPSVSFNALASGSRDAEVLATRAPATRGRPKGSISRPKITLESEEELRSLQVGTLPENIIIEILPPSNPGDDPSAPPQPRRLTKSQAERLAIGLPAKGKGSRGGFLSDKVYLSQAGRRERERERERGRESGSAAAVDSEGTPDLAEGSKADTPRLRDKGKGRSRTGDKAGDGDGESGAGPPLPPDIQIGGLYLTANDPKRPNLSKRAKASKKILIPEQTQSQQTSVPPEGGGRGGRGATPVPEQDAFTAALGSKEVGTVERGLGEDIKMADGEEEEMAVEAPPSPLVAIDAEE